MLDLKQVILNIEGEPAKQNFVKPGMKLDKKGKPVQEENEYREVTVKDVVLQSLLKTAIDDEKDLLKKMKQYQLLKKVQFVDQVELTEEDKILLSELVGLSYNVLMGGQVVELINK